MKFLTKNIFLWFLVLWTANITAQVTNSHYNVKVKGLCGMCKQRIENVAKQNGAVSAVWEAKNQILHLDMGDPNATVDYIMKKIAEAGHDNQFYKAPDEVYNSLASCCHYRKEGPEFESNPLSENKKHSISKNEQDTINPNKTIEQVIVTKAVRTTAVDGKSAGLTFNIHQKELLKAACCNLSESFETNATVDVSFTNAVTGTKQLKMLGLEQKYTALTKELFPEIRGLATAYGLNFIPGRWIGGVQLTKGGSTVVNGYESITGQINTELIKYNDRPETALNFFADNNARVEANITHTSALTKYWNHSILLHSNATLMKIDHNQDGFLDQPTGSQINLAYLLNYDGLESSNIASHFGFNILQDRRYAGQMGFNEKLPQVSQSAYGVGIDISRFQVWNKTGYIFEGKPYQSLGWMNQYTFHQQDSFFGNRTYLGKQHTYYSNLVFESIIDNTNHKYKTGLSFMADNYHEIYLRNIYRRTENDLGAFVEYTWTGNRHTLVAGTRIDFHNLAGTQFLPRLNFKYDLAPKTILRLSAGKGFRTSNIFAESQSFMASNRVLEIHENGGKIYGLQPEIAWNYGVSIQQDFKFLGRASTFIADFFRTYFQNQVLMDLDQSMQKIVFYNLNGNSFANSFQMQWDFFPFRNLELRVAYKYYDVQADYQTGRRRVPFIAKHRGFVNTSYSTSKNDKGGYWSFDATFNFVGKQRLPFSSYNPVMFQLPSYSPSFTTLSAQVSKYLNKKLRIYAGGENLTSYQQERPIVDVMNPFSSFFDGGMIYAPIMPAMFYLGLDIGF